VGSRGDVILSGDYILEDHCIFENNEGKNIVVDLLLDIGMYSVIRTVYD